VKLARKPNSVGHFLVFLAVAALQSALSTKAYARSQTGPSGPLPSLEVNAALSLPASGA